MATKDTQQNTDTSNRGFASMDDDKQREIASQGGRAAHQKGTAHEFSHEEAVAAGRKGGQASHGTSKNSDNDNNEDDKSTSKSNGSSKQGFASMDKDKQHEVASKGGQSSRGSSKNSDSDDDDDNENDQNTSKSSGSGRQGFASMDKDKQREVASKGGRS